jgi:hypothetical protein
MSIAQRYRLRAPSTGHETIIEDAQPGRAYYDRDTGEELDVVGRVVPIEGASKLPWAVENLRFCNHCDQLCQKDLNDCPTCGRRMAPLGS